MELWDLYTESREKTGETHMRGAQLPADRFHLVVHVWIKNSGGQYLISQRAPNRPTFPLMWECVGGSVLRGESSLQGAVREVREEVGIDLLPEAGKLLSSEVRRTIHGHTFQDIRDVWLFPYDGDITLQHATSGEVAAARWMKLEEIEGLYDGGQFVPTLSYIFTNPHIGINPFMLPAKPEE